jgi:hypothetical protein
MHENFETNAPRIAASGETQPQWAGGDSKIHPVQSVPLMHLPRMLSPALPGWQPPNHVAPSIILCSEHTRNFVGDSPERLWFLMDVFQQRSSLAAAALAGLACVSALALLAMSSSMGSNGERRASLLSTSDQLDVNDPPSHAHSSAALCESLLASRVSRTQLEETGLRLKTKGCV